MKKLIQANHIYMDWKECKKNIRRTYSCKKIIFFVV